MCGIIGYTGELDAREVIISALTQLEYRGYDSAGLALQTPDGGLYLQKKAGRVSALAQACDTQVQSHCGIGHTRWATHGGVSDVNAHPHRCGNVVLLHNGIIENYHTLQKQFDFSRTAVSQTDTEVAAQLINHFYQRVNDPCTAIRLAINMLEGSYAFCILFADRPGCIYAVRSVSPLLAAESDKGCFVASDVTALIAYTKNYFVVPEHHILTITASHIEVRSPAGELVKPEMLTVNWDVESAQKAGYPYFMLKEIHEQPQAFHNTIAPRIRDGLPCFGAENIPDELLRECKKIQIVACGTAMYAGMVGRAVIEKKLGLPVTVSIASEFRYDPPMVDEQTLVIVISQSGETIDTLAALRLAKDCGAKVLSIINVKGSTIARESDYVIYTHAGPEISVASTKAYMVQISVLYLLCAKLMQVRGVSEPYVRDFVRTLEDAQNNISAMLEQSEKVRMQAMQLAHAENVFYIGRSMDYAFSMEGALKLKEITYIHAEACAAGELKHGTISLIEPGVPVVAIATQEALLNKSFSNIREVKARGAFVILITKRGLTIPEGISDVQLLIPKTEDCFTVFPIAVLLQLIAYYTAYAKGFDMDKPRNLAKSVTVE